MIYNNNSEFQFFYNKESDFYKVIIYRNGNDLIEVFDDYNKALHFLYGVLV